MHYDYEKSWRKKSPHWWILRFAILFSGYLVAVSQGYKYQLADERSDLETVDRSNGKAFWYNLHLRGLGKFVDDLSSCVAGKINAFTVKVKVADFSNNQLAEFILDQTDSEDLECINFSDNNLHRLPKNLTIFKSLTTLNLSGNRLDRVKDIESIEQIPKLRVLDLSDNYLRSLTNLTSSSLLELHADKNEIKTIKNGTFDGLPSLVTLSMTENPLLYVERPKSKSLKFLDLSSSLGKESLDPEFLNGFPNLLYLKIWRYGRHELDIEKIRHKKLQAIYSNGVGGKHGPTEYLPSLKSYNHDDLEKIQSFLFSPAYEKERTKINELESLDELDELIFQNGKSSPGYKVTSTTPVLDNNDYKTETGVREFGVWIIILICLSIGLLFAIMFFYTFECSPTLTRDVHQEPRSALTPRDPQPVPSISVGQYYLTAPIAASQDITCAPPSYEEAMRVSKLHLNHPHSPDDSNTREKY